MGGMDGMGGMPGMGMMMFAWGAVLLILLAAAALGIAWMVRRSNTNRSVTPAPDTPAEILRRRYAEGEIDEDDYLRRRAGVAD